jgi:3-oxoacyl-[acyl-carrier protein] reductase
MAEVGVAGAGSLQFKAADLADVAAIPGLVKQLRAEFGAFRGLVNNAGIGASGLLVNIPDAQFDQLIRLNIQSPVILTKYLLRSIIAGNGGRIVNISSIVASTGYKGLVAYSATKAAMIGFTKSLAREVGPLGITVNAVAPGFVDTEMTHELEAAHKERIAERSALRRMADAEDVACAVAFLFSEGAKNITGTVLTVDGGGTA